MTSTGAGRRGRRLSSTPQASTTVLLPHEVFSPVRSVLRRLAASLVVLVLVATVVYVDREGDRDTGGGSLSPLDARYYATVTLSTTGYGDIVSASGQARITNVLLVTPLRILFLIILVGTTLEVLTERTREQLRQSRWRTTLLDHTVVVGHGTKGRSAVRALLEDGLEPARLVVVDPDPAHAATATADGLAVVQGDGTRAEVLGQAGIARASKVVVAVPRDDTGGAGDADRARRAPGGAPGGRRPGGREQPAAAALGGRRGGGLQRGGRAPARRGVRLAAHRLGAHGPARARARAGDRHPRGARVGGREPDQGLPRARPRRRARRHHRPLHLAGGRPPAAR